MQRIRAGMATGTLVLICLCTCGCSRYANTGKDAGTERPDAATDDAGTTDDAGNADGADSGSHGDCLPVGAACDANGSCCSGFCMRSFTGDPGTCLRTGCTSHDACNGASGDTPRMCCVRLGDGTTACAPRGEDCSCGDQDGACGASCSCTWLSGCDPGLECLGAAPEDPNAVCTMPCEAEEDCALCHSEHHPVITCQVVYGGDTYCLPLETNEYCVGNADCSGSRICWPLFYEDHDRLGVCAPRKGALPPGAECDVEDNPYDLPFEQRCESFYCIADHCVSLCASQAYCPEPLECRPATFCLREPCDDPDNLVDFPMCQWPLGLEDP